LFASGSRWDSSTLLFSDFRWKASLFLSSISNLKSAIRNLASFSATTYARTVELVGYVSLSPYEKSNYFITEYMLKNFHVFTYAFRFFSSQIVDRIGSGSFADVIVYQYRISFDLILRTMNFYRKYAIKLNKNSIYLIYQLIYWLYIKLNICLFFIYLM